MGRVDRERSKVVDTSPKQICLAVQIVKLVVEEHYLANNVRRQLSNSGNYGVEHVRGEVEIARDSLGVRPDDHRGKDVEIKRYFGRESFRNAALFSLRSKHELPEKCRASATEKAGKEASEIAHCDTLRKANVNCVRPNDQASTAAASNQASAASIHVGG
jgi:hypothetical protein